MRVNQWRNNTFELTVRKNLYSVILEHWEYTCDHLFSLFLLPRLWSLWRQDAFLISISHERTKFNWVNSRIELALLRDPWIRQHPIQQVEGHSHSQELYKMGSFYSQEGLADKLLAKTRKDYFQASTSSFGLKGLAGILLSRLPH